MAGKISRNNGFELLGLHGRVSRRLIRWALVVGGLASLLMSMGEAVFNYREQIIRVEKNLDSVSTFVVPTLVESLWRFDQESVNLHLKSTIALPEVDAAILRLADGSERRFGVIAVSEDTLQREFRLVYDNEGQLRDLGSLLFVADLRPLRQAILTDSLHRLASNSLVILLIVLIVSFGYHRIVRRRLFVIAAELRNITPDDLRQLAPATPVPAAADQDEFDEFDDLAAAIVSLKETGSRALREADAKAGLLQALMDTLDDSRNLLQAVIDTAPTRIFWKDRDLRYLGCNPSFAADAGKTSPAEVIGQDDFQMAWAANAQIYRADDQQVISSGLGRIGYEEPQQQADGQVIWLRTSKVPLRNGHGEIIGVLGIYDDISEIKRAHAELAQHRYHLEQLIDERTAELSRARAAAESANLAKSAFLANMSHEIRTPLNAITGMAHLIRRAGLEPKQMAQLDKLEAASEHLLGIINAVLDLSKIEAGKFVLEESELDVELIFDNVIAMLRQRAQNKQLSLRVELDRVPPRLLGDPTRIQQAVLNFAANAVKFSEAGEVLLRASCEQEAADSVMIRFEVIDHGIGIAPEAISRLFSAFEQADNSTTRKYGGTGLGLAVNRKLAEIMGGEVGVNSALGLGSTFWFTARLGKVNELALPHASTLMAGDSIEARLREKHSGRRVLLAEDEDINREISQELLEEVGLVVDLAVDGAEAVERARTTRYDAILMDMQMPRLDGLAATRQIRQMAEGSTVPIIAMTANAFAEDRQNCFAAGMNDFVAKPVNPDTLFAILLEWLPRRDD